MKSLPPYGKQWRDDPPAAGLWVVTGPRAWAVANSRPFPVCVLPANRQPQEFSWPDTNRPALVIETGQRDDATLYELARELLTAGAPSVTAWRESLYSRPECLVTFRGTDA